MNKESSEVRSEVDGAALRAVMRHVPSPVTVVTVGGATPRGITIGSFTSTSLDPPLVSFNVECVAQAHDVLAATPRYAVHLLGEEQAFLSDHFAVPDRSSAEQFDPVSFRLDDHGTPLLDGVVAILHCSHYADYEAGDHTIFVGEVVAIEEGPPGRPLLYYNRSYRSVGEALEPTLFPAVKRGSSDTP